MKHYYGQRFDNTYPFISNDNLRLESWKVLFVFSRKTYFWYNFLNICIEKAASRQIYNKILTHHIK